MKIIILVLALLGLSPVSQASIINPGFESGDLTGWSSIGDVSVTGTIFGVAPPEGIYQAVITNSPAFRYGLDSELILPLSGSPSEGIDSPIIEPFFGVPSLSLIEAVGGGILGQISGIKTSFFGERGDQLSFKWNLLSNLYPYPGLVILDGSIFCLIGCLDETSVSSLAISPQPGQFSNSGFSMYDFQTGYHLFSLPITSTGLHTLSFAAIAHSDQEGATALLIDAVSIPEPASLLLLIFGLLVLAFKKSSQNSCPVVNGF